MKYRNPLLIFLTSASLCGCLLQKFNIKNIKSIQPPGVLYFNDSLMWDETEITNINYREYLYYTYSHFGRSSVEYQKALPDTLVWLLKEDSCNSLYSNCELYLRHPKYADFPVVGVSQSQANAYSEWRTDRVLEFILVALNHIDYDPFKTGKQRFTTRRYYTDSLNYLNTDLKLPYYPQYRLPAFNERAALLSYLDSIPKSKAELKYMKKHPFEAYYINQDIHSLCDSSKTYTPPTASVYKNYYKSIYGIRGNVREWVQEDNLACGGTTYDSLEFILKYDSITVIKPDVSSGFRNVCEWIKWGE